MTTTTTSTKPTTQRWLDTRAQYVPNGVFTYHDLVVDRAHGAAVWDVDGNRYIDFAGGIGTLNVGHTPERVVRAIEEQAQRLIHMAFPVASYPGYIELAERLATVAPGDTPKKTLLVNSGAEAVENAVKIARAATGRPAIIAFENGFHGRTLMGMSLTGKERPYKVGFGPFAPEIYHAAFPYSYRCECDDHQRCSIESGDDLERFLAETVAAEDVAAIIVEPIQGEGGFVVAPGEWLRALRRICDREGIVLIADEVQTGFGRTGRMFAVEHSGIEPDLIVMAKSIAAGMPLAAVVGKAEIMNAPGPGGIGGTYGGNPVACAAALAVLDMFEEEGLVARAQQIGGVIEARFRAMGETYPIIGEARGLGAMQAIELVTDRTTKEPAAAAAGEIIHRSLDEGLIIIKAGLYDNVVRVLVPLVVEDRELEDGLNILEGVLADASA